ncbi:hypothetical protein [Peribacillus sp. TH14]|uniref:hypothetical protein n=1 Tax=Peribacillus sp. TH14 TaxID=2798481 RepID=UPI0019124C68|nr:hypothetical protein [Peribacillus sp. TH14]MBK5497434.1 hypothetical protein [Peribacillus sp. TH14]
MRNAESIVIKNTEEKYLYSKCYNVYIMLEDEDIDWYWDESEIMEFDLMFNEGATVLELSQHFCRPTVEIALLTIDRDLKGLLEVNQNAN